MTLLTARIRSGATGTYKHGYRFHPLGCWLDETGEALAAILRPGNAGSNTTEDHFTVLGLALAQLPAEESLFLSWIGRSSSALRSLERRTRSRPAAAMPGSVSGRLRAR
jgi:hypothetical protein